MWFSKKKILIFDSYVFINNQECASDQLDFNQYLRFQLEPTHPEVLHKFFFFFQFRQNLALNMFGILTPTINKNMTLVLVMCNAYDSLNPTNQVSYAHCT